MFTPLTAIVTTMILTQPHVDPAAEIASLKGTWTVVHVLPREPSPRTDAFVEGIVRATPTLAGVRQVFVTSETDARRWGARLGVAESEAWSDPSGELGRALAAVPVPSAGVSTSATPPTTYVFMPSGDAMTRFSDTTGDFASFGAIASAIEAARKAPTAEYNLPKGKTLAVAGYDVVAYFTDNKAVKGDEAITSLYRGVTYRFATREHRALFAAQPDKYVPTYGGWCASAMGAKGTKVEIDPEYFKVKGGRLFLFYKDVFSNALADWNKHEREWEPAADANWMKIAGESPTSTTTNSRTK